jgi:hypothetical protein
LRSLFHVREQRTVAAVHAIEIADGERARAT